jgi:putative membrane protein
MVAMRVTQLVPAAVGGLVLSLVAGTVSPAGAQYPASPPAAMTDSMFVKEASSGGLAEVGLGQMAQEKAQNADVKEFGKRMVTDHSKANKQLMTAAATAGIMTSSTLLPKHQETVKRLSALSGAAFDTAYMTAMVEDHTEDVALFQQQAKSAKAKSLRQVAEQTLPTLEEHLKLAKQVAEEVGAGSAKASRPDTTTKKPSPY